MRKRFWFSRVGGMELRDTESCMHTRWTVIETVPEKDVPCLIPKSQAFCLECGEPLGGEPMRLPRFGTLPEPWEN